MQAKGSKVLIFFDKKNRNPLGVDIPFLSDTATGDQFKPFKFGEDDYGNQAAPKLKKVCPKLLKII